MLRTLLVLVLTLVATSLARAAWESAHWLERGTQAEAKQRHYDTVVFYRRAATWYFPLNPWSAKALAKLSKSAARFEQKSDRDLALFAWRGVRGAILSTRSFYTPHPQTLARANQRIAALMAAYKPRPKMDEGKTTQALTQEHLALLEGAQGRPHTGWSIGAIVTFLVGLCLLTLAVARPTWKARVPLLLGATIALAVYLLSLWLA